MHYAWKRGFGRISGLEDIIDSLERYIQHGIPTGGFLEAVISNNLQDACRRADEQNRYRLFDIVAWLYNEAPIECWGSPEAYIAWIELHRRRLEER